MNLLDEVSDDFCVGFGDELVSLSSEFAFEIEVVFDDTVVDHDDAAGAVTMGMGVLFSGAAVRGPARMPDAVSAIERIPGQNLFKILQLTRSTAYLKESAAGTSYSDSG